MLPLIPAVPFLVINFLIGLMPVRIRTYWRGSQIGMLPGTAVYVYFGSSVPKLTTVGEKCVQGILSPQLFVAFALLGIVPLVLKKTEQRFRPTVATAQSKDSEVFDIH